METRRTGGGLKLANIRRILKFLQVDTGPARNFVNWFIRHYGRLIEERQVRLTPAMVMLGEDICAHYVLLSRRHQLINQLEALAAEAAKATEPQTGTKGTETKGTEATKEAAAKKETADTKPAKAADGVKAKSPDDKSADEVKGKSADEAKPTFVLPDLKAIGSLFDDVLKLRERLRKCIGEFQSVLEQAGVPVDSALDEFLSADLDVPAADPAPPEQTDGMPLTEIRPDVQAVQPPDAAPEVAVSAVSTVSTMSAVTNETEKESSNAGVSNAVVAGPFRRKAPTGPIRESLARAYLSGRVAGEQGKKEGALLGSGRGQDDRDRDTLRVGVGVAAAQADAGGDTARGAPRPADAAHPRHV